ncbi:hypothetical protein IU449_27080 [Nocardia higoensis]|uniref:Uncharacterized protein n=1 Tax=Nocardia higoensis TaxID=228599 RepID=A0ABS0DI76_9NOCA|nr:hypothetical protein [Nocardia higoensis]MBF6358165.1 hypothetical protein [Nocardia higoensis]
MCDPVIRLEDIAVDNYRDFAAEINEARLDQWNRDQATRYHNHQGDRIDRSD